MRQPKTARALGAALTALGAFAALPALAQTPAPPVPPPAATPPVPATPAPAAPAPPSAPPAPSLPSMSSTLAANSSPTLLNAGPLGNVYVTGVVSGLAQVQDNRSLVDRTGQADLDNGMIFVNKTTGTLQYFVQAGAYSLPDLGAPYIRSKYAPGDFYGALPQALVKYVPNSTFSIEAGKLPTLIGAEYTWSFENYNIERGLLWNQENAVNRGVQVNYAKGPLTLAASLNDGFYSNVYSWIWGSVTDAVDKNDTVALIGGGNMAKTTINTTATPLLLNNEQMYNIIYTHLAGQFTFEPYVQYTYVPKDSRYGTTKNADTTGVALNVIYAFKPTAKMGSLSLAGATLPVRLEYITSNGSPNSTDPSLIYGPGSNAYSLTITPTYQNKLFFARAELSYVKADRITDGDALGASGSANSQTRFLLESGILF